MKTLFKAGLIPLSILASMGQVAAHVDGAHTGGLLQSLLHILQSPEHLVVMLATAVVVSLLIRGAIKKRD